MKKIATSTRGDRSVYGPQQDGALDAKTSSWIRTPSRIRKLGGALFCDRRYDTLFPFLNGFLYRNGTESDCAARGFRGLLAI